MIYVNQPLQIEITCTVDGSPMSTATGAVIAYRRPDKVEGNWSASIDGSKVVFKATSQLDKAGPWKLQPIVTFASGDTIPGQTVDLEIKPRFS
jgi:hypothetical protein